MIHAAITGVIQLITTTRSEGAPPPPSAGNAAGTTNTTLDLIPVMFNINID